VSQGLSIANNLLANAVQYNLDKNQEALQTSVTRLSSGLRINTAADDPSGLAIATNLQTQVDGFQQAVQNVQNANNAAQVADGALSTTTDILQRIRSLAVEASSDISSNSDRQNLQSEVSQLLLEVNRISQDTSFNGQALLDGSHAGFQAEINASLNITANAALASNSGTLQTGFLIASIAGVGVGTSTAFNTTANAAGGNFQGDGSGTGTGTVDGTIELQVINNGISIGVQETFVSSNSGQVTTSSATYFAGQTFQDVDNVQITLGNVTTADVGTTAYVKISQNVAALTNPGNPAFNFQSGADEGDTIQIGFEATNTQTLRVSNINLALSSSSNPSLGAEDAIGQIDNALDHLLNQRAQLGAIIVRLNEDANNDNVASTNLQASESQIRDLNVGQETTNFTKLQVLVQVGTSVLAQSNSNAQTVLGLFR
jgi:flagellin